MHRCVCIWRYILQNYNYKLHFQNLSIYHIPHVSIGTRVAENLDVCTDCDLWDSNIQLTMGKDWRKYMLGLLLILISKSWGCPHLGPGMPFLHKDTFARAGRGCWGYLFLPGFSFLYDAIHGWMTGRMNEWMKSFTKNDHDVLYYM
jgi:hypothetical protein